MTYDEMKRLLSQIEYAFCHGDDQVLLEATTALQKTVSEKRRRLFTTEYKLQAPGPFTTVSLIERCYVPSGKNVPICMECGEDANPCRCQHRQNNPINWTGQ